MAMASGWSRSERQLPGYLIVGTKRGGSTSLAMWIEEHPEVGRCRATKGTHYFDVNFDRGWRWYLRQFPSLAEGYRITGESSPYYMFHPLAPQRIHDALPEVKLIACLRDPVARAWSQHAYEFARGKERLGFREALDREGARLTGEVERLVADPSYEADHYRHHTYLQRGHYAEQLQTLYALFPSEHILVLKSETLFAAPAEELARVYRFLGLSPFRPSDLQPRNANKPYGTMDADLVVRLQDYYRPLNEQLRSMPGVGFSWDYDG